MSDAEFRAQLQASGMSYDELRKRARMDLEKAMMIEQEVRAKINVPDADIKAYYDAHKEDFTITKERLKLAQILIALPPNPTPAQVSAAQKKADDGSRARRQGRRLRRSRARVFGRRLKVQRRRTRMVRAVRHQWIRSWPR